MRMLQEEAGSDPRVHAKTDEMMELDEQWERKRLRRLRQLLLNRLDGF